jgi:hypothetical protein
MMLYRRDDFVGNTIVPSSEKLGKKNHAAFGPPVLPCPIQCILNSRRLAFYFPGNQRVFFFAVDFYLQRADVNAAWSKCWQQPCSQRARAVQEIL